MANTATKTPGRHDDAATGGPRGLRERQKRRRRQALLAAAHAVFDEKGYDAASLQEIADRAEVGIATLYNYFGSKRRLLFELVVGSLDGLSQQLALPDPETTQRLDVLLTDWIHRGVSETLGALGPRVWSAVIREEYNVEHDPDSMYAGIKDRIVARYESFVEALAAAGLIRTDFPTRDVACLLDAIAIEVFWAVVVGNVKGDKALRKRIAGLVAPLVGGLKNTSEQGQNSSKKAVRSR